METQHRDNTRYDLELTSTSPGLFNFSVGSGKLQFCFIQPLCLCLEAPLQFLDLLRPPCCSVHLKVHLVAALTVKTLTQFG